MYEHVLLHQHCGFAMPRRSINRTVRWSPVDKKHYCLICRERGDKRPLFRVKHPPVQEQNPDSVVKKRINPLTLFCSSPGKLKCQRCSERRRECMMSDKTQREVRGRTGILSSGPQCRAFTRGIWISLIIHTLCPVLRRLLGVKGQEGETWYCRHHRRNQSDILASSLGSS